MYSGIPAGGSSAGGFAVSPTAPAALASGVAMHGLPVYAPGVLTTTTTPSHSMTYSAPQTYLAPQTYSEPQTYSALQVPMNDMVTTSTVGSQSMAAASKVVVHPPVTVTAEEFAKIN